MKQKIFKKIKENHRCFGASSDLLPKIIDEIEGAVKQWEARAVAGREAIRLLRELKFGTGDGSPRYPGDGVTRGMLLNKTHPMARGLVGCWPMNEGGGNAASELQSAETSSAEQKPTKLNRFRGVYPKTYKSGVTKYKASYWDKKKKKHVYLGMFNNPYEAAAAYQDHIGDHQEAKLLRAMAGEQAELNPDKPITSNEKAEMKKAKKYIWVCKRCGLEYKSRGTCAGCGYDDMREVPID